ncbi:MAG: hypothetical protein IJV13_08810 [Prevotella sp.]|nr:hypothetical protein [Prevotella sp.]
MMKKGFEKGGLSVRVRYLHNRMWKEKTVALAEVFAWISGEKYRKRVDAVRGRELIMTREGMESGYIAAEELPMVFIGCETGLVLLSVRVEYQEELEALRRRVNLFPQTVMSFAGSSGRSLKIVMRFALTDGSLPTEARESELFSQYALRRAADFLFATTGMRADEAGSDHFRVSADVKAMLNETAVAVMMPQPTEPLSDATAPILHRSEEPELNKDVLPGYTRREMDITKFNMLCRQLAFDRWQEPDEQLLQLSVECRKAGIDHEVAAKCILALPRFREKESLVRSSLENAYCKHPAGRKNPLEPSLIYQQLMQAFIKRRYSFRKNTVTGDIEYQEKGRYNLSWRPFTEEVRNDMNSAAIDEGIKVWSRDLDRMLNSATVTDYDPVREWLGKLPQWDGRDRLGEMADRVPTDTPEWRSDFKVWMRSMVSQWMGRNRTYGAQMVLMLVGAQGTRKSTFMRLLLPDEMAQFYIDRIDFTNKKEALRALSRFLLINIDEYDQISPSQTAYLKHLIQRTDVKERKMYETTYQQLQRYAAFCATTNSLHPLKDESGSRRYLVVEVSGRIDTDTQGDRRIDYPQLYAQIVEEVRRGEPCYFDGAHEQRIQERNRDYYETPTVVSLFDDMFRKPEAGDKLLSLSPTEILSIIRKERHVNIVNQSNATLIGAYLKRCGYKKTYRSYNVTIR